MGGWVGVPKIKQIKFTELGVHIPNKKYIYKKKNISVDLSSSQSPCNFKFKPTRKGTEKGRGGVSFLGHRNNAVSIKWVLKNPYP
jgi:hypothetical protein